MTEPWQSMMTERLNTAKFRVKNLIAMGSLTFLNLEEALQGLTLEQRLEIKQGLAKAGLLP